MKRSVILALSIAVGGAAVLAGGAAVWRWRIAHRTVYTDGQTIKQPIQHALVRDVLWKPPTPLPASINTVSQESQPRLSADGLSLYFVRRETGGSADIYVSTRLSTADEHWSEPQPLVEINTSDDETSPAPSADGRSLFFCSNRSGGLGGDDLWVSRRGELGWQPPINLGPAVNTEYDERDPAISNDHATLYFSSNRPRADAAPAQSRPANPPQRDLDLYIASILSTGEILPAAPLAALNSPFDDRSPAITAAGDFLYFCSDRPGSRGGFDLYRAWLVRGEFMTPTNLGPDVNTTADERDPAICLAGFGLYFSSDRIVDVMEAPAESGRRDDNLYCTTSREVFTEVEPAGPLVDWASMWALLGPTILWLLLGLGAVAVLVVIAKRMRSGKLSLLARCLLASLAAHLLIMVGLTFWRVTASLAHIVQHGELMKVAISSGGADALAAQVRGELTAVVPASARGELTRAQGDVAREPAPSVFALATAKSTAPLERSSVQLHPNEAPIPDRPLIAPVVTPTVEASVAANVVAPADAARLAMAEAQHAPPSEHALEQGRDRAIDRVSTVRVASSSATLQPQHPADKASPDRSLAAAAATNDSSAASSAMPKPALERLAEAPAATVSVASPPQSTPQRVAETQPPDPSAAAQQRARDRTVDAIPTANPAMLSAQLAPQHSTNNAAANHSFAAGATVNDSASAASAIPKPAIEELAEAESATISVASPRGSAPQQVGESQPSAPAALAQQRGRDRTIDATTAIHSATLTARLAPQQSPGSAPADRSLAAAATAKESSASTSAVPKPALEPLADADAATVSVAAPRSSEPQRVGESQPSGPVTLAQQRGRDRVIDAIPSVHADTSASANLAPQNAHIAYERAGRSLAATPSSTDAPAIAFTAPQQSPSEFAAASPANPISVAAPREGVPQQVAEANQGVAAASIAAQRGSSTASVQMSPTSLAVAALAPMSSPVTPGAKSERSLAAGAMPKPSDLAEAGVTSSASGNASASALAADVPGAALPHIQAPLAPEAGATGGAAGVTEADVRIAAQSSRSAGAHGDGSIGGKVDPAQTRTIALGPATQPSAAFGGTSLAVISSAALQDHATSVRSDAGGSTVAPPLTDLPARGEPAIGLPAPAKSALATAGETETAPAAKSAKGASGARADYVLGRQAPHEGGIAMAPQANASTGRISESSLAAMDQRALGRTGLETSVPSGSAASPPSPDAVDSGLPALAPTTFSLPQGETIGGPAAEAAVTSAHAVEPSSARSGSGTVGLVRANSKPVTLAPQSGAAAVAADIEPSSFARGGSPKDSPIILAAASSAPTESSGADVNLSLPAIDVRVPTEITPLANPYVARTEDKRMEIVKQMGGSEATERAVSLALKWLAAHQNPDGRWAAKDFDDRCGECGGLAKFDTDIATTGLALLCFLGADHTHVKDGPYRQNVERALNWLLSQQKPDGDLRGSETMYSHGIGAIAISESFGMTGDPKLLEPLKNAIEFIGRSRNRRTGGWRYEPGQVGDTSVLGWQVMALISARRAGIAIPVEALESARQWLEGVSTPTKPGLYAYQPGQRYSPSMTAESMFVQQLLGMDHEDARMQASAEFVMQNPPRWNNDPNSYYWYYATLALFQYQGNAWTSWNKSITDELLANQRPSGAAAGSWDPVDNWSKIGGRIYQTAVCTLCLEVYYRYLPMYASVKTDESPKRGD